MKPTFGRLLFHLLLCCAAQTLVFSQGVRIESVPAANSEDVIQTELTQTISLACQAEGASAAEEELVWLRNGAAVNLNEGNTMGNSKVCVTPVILADNDATFTCHLKENATIRASVTLDVLYPPEQSTDSMEITVEEEEKLTLSCNTKANPLVSSVSWMLNGTAVDLLGGAFILSNDGSESQLSNGKVDRSLHQGTYQCTVTSPKYGQYNKVFIVTVTDKTVKFPLMPIIAGVVVVALTAILAVAARWRKIAKCCK